MVPQLDRLNLTVRLIRRRRDERSGSLFSYVDLEGRVGKDHPLRTIPGVGGCRTSSRRCIRGAIPPEKLLRAMLLQAFYSIRSERQLMERLEFDLLFRWFVGIGVDDAAWEHSTFSKNRERLLEGDIAAKLLSAALSQPGVKHLLCTDHFSVEGTLIEAWASMKSDAEQRAERVERVEPPVEAECELIEVGL